MALAVNSLGAGSGPGSRPIATTLLELLAIRGRSVEAARATRALDSGEGGIAEAPVWLADQAIAKMFVAGRVEEVLARSIGHRLVTPEATGLLLYGLGLATPEKAYRRIQSLLPRESRISHWCIDEIGDGRASLTYQVSRTGAAGGPGMAALCALRRGMLEAIPGLYGLLPARVNEPSCLARGDDACRYEVVWQREFRNGLFAGLGLGGGLALGLVTTIGVLASSPISVLSSGMWMLGMLATGGAIGRCVDLSRQLEAVAGARRGQLALLDQADDLLASKIDAIARADAKLDSETPPRRVDVRVGEEEGEEDPSAFSEREQTVHGASLEIFSVAGDLERVLEEREKPMGPEPSEERALVRVIRDQAARIAGVSAPAEGGARPMALGDLVARALVSARPSLERQSEIEIDCDPDLPLVDCEPVQIEQVVIQLLRNAVEASAELMDVPRVDVSLRRAPGGVELAVEDRGPGMDSSEIDEVFDPFFAESPVGAGGGFGLPVCLRIVEGHGGEMRIETGDRAGTRVSVLLPERGRRESNGT